MKQYRYENQCSYLVKSVAHIGSTQVVIRKQTTERRDQAFGMEYNAWLPSQDIYKKSIRNEQSS